MKCGNGHRIGSSRTVIRAFVLTCTLVSQLWPAVPQSAKRAASVSQAASGPIIWRFEEVQGGGRPPTTVLGAPRSVAGREVDSVREEWVVEDRWWTGKPLRRRYFEVVLLDGRNVVVFRDLVGGGWFLQRS